MKYLFFLLLSSLLLFAACKAKNDAPIPAEQMKKILTDMHFAEVYSMMVNDSTHQARNRNNDSLAVYYRTVLNHYHITAGAFTDAINWYRHNPDQLDSVYTHMIPDLTALESKTTVKK